MWTVSDSTSAENKTKPASASESRDKKVASAQAKIDNSALASATKEADEKGYFGSTDEEVPTSAFTFGGVAADPERAAVSGRPHVARKLERNPDGSKKSE